MANMVGLTVARNAMAGVDVRAEGVTNLPRPLRFYASDQVHSCHQKAMETLGLGNRALVHVTSDADFRMDIPALEKAIADDRAAGLRPACVIATAGTTNTGSIDDLKAIGELCRREGLWFHVDGCIGALIKIAPQNAFWSKASKRRIRWRSTRTNGCTRRLKRAARWCGTAICTFRRSPCMATIWRKSRAASPPVNIFSIMASNCRVASRR